MTTVIGDATLIDGLGGDPQRHASIVIDDGRITRVGVRLEPPRDAEVIDAAGATVMPGLIDCHVHFFLQPATLQDNLLMPPTLRAFHAARNAKATLDAGITSA